MKKEPPTRDEFRELQDRVEELEKKLAPKDDEGRNVFLKYLREKRVRRQ